MKNMNILVDINHPAHNHLFRNFIFEMKKRGHQLIVITRDKEVTLDLLKKYQIKHINLGKPGKGMIRKALKMLSSDLRFFFILKKYKPNVALSTASPSLAQASYLLGIKHLIFGDTEHAKRTYKLSVPFSKYIITPSSFKDDYGKKHVRYKSFHELAYLHPKYFKPNSSILKKLGLKKSDKFFILRFVSWEAEHDIGQKGLTNGNKRDLIKILETHGIVFISSENKLPKESEKYRLKVASEKMHDILYYATICISEGGTTASEAAVLGTPTIHFSTTGKYCGVFDDLEKNYGLLQVIEDYDKLIEKLRLMLQNKKIKSEWREKRKRLLNDKIDLTDWMVKFVEGEIDGR